MALIQCPDCRREVSDRAPACPNCGAPIAASLQPQVMAAPVREIKARSSVADGVKIGCGIFIVLPLLILLGLVIFGGVLSGVSDYNKRSAASSTPGIDNSPTPEAAAERDAITDAHNNGWSWAQAKNLTSPEACSAIKDFNTREGCEAYARHPAPAAAASSEQPTTPSDRLN